MKTKQKKIEETDKFYVYIDATLGCQSRKNLAEHMLKLFKPKGLAEMWKAAIKMNMVLQIWEETRYRGAGLYRINYKKKGRFLKKYKFTWKKLT